MGTKSSRKVAATAAVLALAAFPAGAAASKDYSQNSVSGDAAAPLPAEILKDYSKNSVGGDYGPPTGSVQPATRVERIRYDPGFAWGDASAGAGVALGLALLGMTTARKIRRRRVSPPSPAQPRTV